MARAYIFCQMLLSVDTPGHLKWLSFLALVTAEGSSFTERCNTYHNPWHVQITWLNETWQTIMTSKYPIQSNICSNRRDKTLHCRAEEQKGDNDMSVNIVSRLNVILRISTFCALAFQHYCFEHCNSLLQNQSKTTGLASWLPRLSSYYTDHSQLSQVLLFIQWDLFSSCFTE